MRRQMRCLAATATLAVATVTGSAAPVAVVSADTAISITEPEFAIGQCRAVAYCYGPQTAQGLSSTPVRWTNSTEIAHSATGDGFDVLLGAGQSGSWTFPTPGTYLYHCRFWPDMKGTLVIAPLHPPVAALVPPAAASGHPPPPAPTLPASTPSVAPSEAAAPVAPGGVATILLPNPSLGVGGAPPADSARPRSAAPPPSPLGTSPAAGRRPPAFYMIAVLLFAAVIATAFVRRGLGWWRRVSADPLGDDTLAGLA